MKFSIDLDDMVHFKQGLDTLSDFERQVLHDGAVIAQDRLLTRLRTYPTQQRRQLPAGIPKSRAQARKIAMLIKTGKVPYKRTGAHAAGWRAQVVEVSSGRQAGTTLQVNFENLARGFENMVIVTPTGKNLSKRRLQTTLKGYYAAFLRAPWAQYRMFRGYWANVDTILGQESKFIRDAFREASAFLGKQLVRK